MLLKKITFFALYLCCAFASVGGASDQTAEIVLFENSSPQYRAFVRGQHTSNDEIIKALNHFAANGEPAAICTLLLNIKDDAKDRVFNSLTSNLKGISAEFLGIRLFQRETSKCLKWFQRAEKYGVKNEQDFWFNFASALILHHSEFEGGSHVALTKVWNFIKDLEKSNSIANGNNVFELRDENLELPPEAGQKLLYLGFFNAIKETDDEKLFKTFISEKPLKLKELGGSTFSNAFLQVFAETKFMNLYLEETSKKEEKLIYVFNSSKKSSENKNNKNFGGLKAGFFKKKK